jgi:filamin
MEMALLKRVHCANSSRDFSGISFVPLEPGEHLVRVRKSGEDVPGSPFAILVEAAEAPNAVGRPCDVQLDIPELNLPEDLPKLKSTLRRPGSDVEEPITLKVLSDNTLSASFVPKSPGEHLITVKKNNRHVTGSPFSVMVTAAEPANRYEVWFAPLPVCTSCKFILNCQSSRS